MLNIVGLKKWYFIFSLAVIIPGIVALFMWGLNMSIDFTGGSRLILMFKNKVSNVDKVRVQEIFKSEKIEIVTIQQSNERLIIRTKSINEKTDAKLIERLNKELGGVKQEEFETVGPTIGGETTRNAFMSLVLASVLIVIYIAISFRSVPRPTSSWRFGVCAIIALVHDVFVLLGVFAFLGHFFKVEIDSLFITALLTVIGFSVHDTIVVFDRIRENLKTSIGLPFEQIVNNSILQTLVRSLNTSFTAILVLFTLLIFGGESMRWFVVALLVGIISGTYSSIFNAAPLLVLWQEIDTRQKNKSV